MDKTLRENRRRRLKEVRIEEFFDKLQRPEGCWLFDGAREVNGYGYLVNPLNDGPKYITAHRVAWILKNGPIPEGMVVMHKCDIRACCNPDHLRLGTHADNAQDTINKGRNSSQGVRNLHAVLSEEQVREVLSRSTGARGEGAKFAREYKVSPGTMHALLRGKSWAHIPRARPPVKRPYVRRRSSPD